MAETNEIFRVRSHLSQIQSFQPRFFRVFVVRESDPVGALAVRHKATLRLVRHGGWLSQMRINWDCGRRLNYRDQLRMVFAEKSANETALSWGKLV